MSAELREALNAAGASPFLPKVIDPVLVELQRRYSPLVTAIPAIQWPTDVYNFNTRTQTASGGWVSDGGASPVSNSVFIQNQYKMAHFQTVGAVTGYAQEVTQQLVNLRETEIKGSIRGMTWDVETALLWASAGCTANGARPQFDGLDTLISQYSGANQNAIDANGASLNLSTLDRMIDMVETNAAEPTGNSPWALVMSSTANSKIANLLTPQQRFVDKVEVAPGLNVMAYRDIPILKSSFLQARALSMGTVTATPSANGGSLAAGQYFYRISPIIARQGEISPSAEVSATTTGATGSVALAFAIPTGLEGAQPTLYKVWRGTAAGGETLLGWVDATVGLAADGITAIPTTTITDTGTALVPSNGATVPGIQPAQYYGTNSGIGPGGQGLENIYLISRDPQNLVRPWVRQYKPLDLYPTTASPDSMPYALITDTTLGVRAAKFVGRTSRVAVSI
ncbi:hypothetical protein KGQ20_02100 [Catenulispora sp. NF23]|uniref:Phage major capsid protein n=1 Tax=Catenulispora pinistramenti TaxID=2705254 RepID=A0ABS5KJ76_9ACTN|nr:hypothetical protein [Catenulispora pinistramenti]MBS2531557.1 hypothetical protein [Catenulispora pinistramenti]MBS2546193.1 hypothetical protein [Catenulispora pinistramenti]